VTLIVGLGNPGARYDETRHNIGFQVVDQLTRLVGAPGYQVAHQGMMTAFVLHGERVRVLKPMTYMNRSGHSVRAAAQFYEIEPVDVLVVHDELDLGFGQLRLKQGGGDAGHNGLRSVTAELGCSGYGRLRMGIGRPAPDFSGTIADYVLRGFASEELALLPGVISAGAEALRLVVQLDLAAAMNQVNRRVKDSTSETTN
jgi:PTH1 family peptidyl-tRNA hydrolase